MSAYFVEFNGHRQHGTFGPFPSFETANEWARGNRNENDRLDGYPYMVRELTPPSPLHNQDDGSNG